MFPKRNSNLNYLVDILTFGAIKHPTPDSIEQGFQSTTFESL